MSKPLVVGFCPVSSLPRSGWVLRSVRVLTLVFVRLLVLLLVPGGAGMANSGSTSLGSVRTVLVLSLLNRLVLILLDLAGPKKLHALMRSWRFDAGWLSAKTASGTLRNLETRSFFVQHLLWGSARFKFFFFVFFLFFLHIFYFERGVVSLESHWLCFKCIDIVDSTLWVRTPLCKHCSALFGGDDPNWQTKFRRWLNHQLHRWGWKFSNHIISSYHEPIYESLSTPYLPLEVDILLAQNL